MGLWFEIAVIVLILVSYMAIGILILFINQSIQSTIYEHLEVEKSIVTIQYRILAELRKMNKIDRVK
jgi:hypothetical protein